MQFDWDDDKALSNAEKHGVVFDVVRSFEIVTAVVVEDDRKDYGELRLVALGLIGPRVHVLVYTERGRKVRVISLRKANRKEIEAYVESL